MVSFKVFQALPPPFTMGLNPVVCMDKLEIWSEEVGFFPSVRQAYGCVNGNGWIINFGNTNQPDQIPVEIRNYFERQLQVGPPKWFLSLEFPHWRWT